MHSGEDAFTLSMYNHAHLQSDGGELVGYHLESLAAGGHVCDDYHVKVSADDGLRDVEDVDVRLRQICTDARDDADAILSDYGDDDIVHIMLLCDFAIYGTFLHI